MQINKMAVLITIVVVALVASGLYLLFSMTSSAGSSGVTVSSTSSNIQNVTVSTSTATTTPTSSSTPSQPSKLGIQVIKPGTGDGAKMGDSLTVNYTGSLTNGTVFDSSLKPGHTPFTFILGSQIPGKSVIQGWNQGLLGVKAGEELKLTVPPQLGYGPNDYGPIPGNSTLLFDITLLKIN
jgi:FKBP-type peptidyl-prolyl cis-trans isomerase